MTNTPIETTTPTEMDSWAMACSLLVGVRQAVAKGKSEHAAITAANPNRTFFAEAAVVADTVAILQDVERALDWELSRTARSSNLAMPERG